jgi:hypothetical protein
VHNDRTIPKNKREKIMRDNDKGTCMLIDVVKLRESVIYTFSVKGIKYHSINREIFGTELMRVCCVFCRTEKIWTSCW